jgi:hypothetical protein
VQVIDDRGNTPDLVHDAVDDRRRIGPDHLQNFASPGQIVDCRAFLRRSRATENEPHGATEQGQCMRAISHRLSGHSKAILADRYQ